MVHHPPVGDHHHTADVKSRQGNLQPGSLNVEVTEIALLPLLDGKASTEGMAAVVPVD
jgi:hypothetical protein